MLQQLEVFTRDLRILGRIWRVSQLQAGKTYDFQYKNQSKRLVRTRGGDYCSYEPHFTPASEF